MKETFWLIWSNEHGGWWMPKQRGYTSHLKYAGRYSFEEAKETCEMANANRELPLELMCPDFEK